MPKTGNTGGRGNKLEAEEDTQNENNLENKRD